MRGRQPQPDDLVRIERDYLGMGGQIGAVRCRDAFGRYIVVELLGGREVRLWPQWISLVEPNSVTAKVALVMHS